MNGLTPLREGCGGVGEGTGVRPVGRRGQGGGWGTGQESLVKRRVLDPQLKDEQHSHPLNMTGGSVPRVLLLLVFYRKSSR